jgi:predicted dehydrogenase
MTQDLDSRMNVAVVGAGRMGKHHARTYASLPNAKLIGVVDPNLAKAGLLTKEFGGIPFSSPDELLKAFPSLQAVSIASTTTTHETASLPFLRAGIACLIEKPIAADPATGQRILDAASASGATLQVGHTERFNPAIRALARLKIRPRYIEASRISPMTFRSLDIGVVMDMMIHDLDIILSLVDSLVTDVQATGVSVIGSLEDVANARIVFADGTVANVTASRMALKTDRRLRLFSQDAFVSLDYQKRTGVAIRKTDNKRALDEVRAKLAGGQDLSTLDYAGLVKLSDLSTLASPDASDPSATIADPLAAELTSFLHAAKTKTTPVVDGAAGLAAVQLAQRILQVIKSHAV